MYKTYQIQIQILTQNLSKMMFSLTLHSSSLNLVPTMALPCRRLKNLHCNRMLASFAICFTGTITYWISFNQKADHQNRVYDNSIKVFRQYMQ